MSLGRSGLFLLVTSLFTALFYGAFRLGDSPELGAIAKMLGEANYAFLILFLYSQRKALSRSIERKSSLAVLLVSLIHLSLNLTLTGLWQMGLMTLQVLVLIGWVATEAWRLYRIQPHASRGLLALLVTGHWLAECVARNILLWQLWQGKDQIDVPGWTDASLDWMWVTFFLGFMAQLAVAGVVAQALRQEKERLEQLVHHIEGRLQEKESLVMTLLASNAAREDEPQMASLAHELRQPLCSIQLNAEYLTHAQRLSREEETQVLQEILRENHRAIGIVQGLRSLFTDRAPDATPILLGPLLRTWVSHQAPALAQQFGIQIRLHIQTQATVQGNTVQIEMLLKNLVHNAVEAMASGGGQLIDITLWTQRQQAVIDVLDNGPGLPPELYERVFELSYSNKKDGMGMGLWLSRRIAHRHQGQLICVPSPSGTCMRLSLPLEQT